MNLFIVDAFTDRPFAGNPAAVCLLDEERDAGPPWGRCPMQTIAAEMNLSETAFVRPLDEGFELRWFTPAIEVDLCGHATLASAHALWTEGVVNEGRSTLWLRHTFPTCLRLCSTCWKPIREHAGFGSLSDFDRIARP